MHRATHYKRSSSLVEELRKWDAGSGAIKVVFEMYGAFGDAEASQVLVVQDYQINCRKLETGLWESDSTDN